MTNAQYHDDGEVLSPEGTELVQLSSGVAPAIAAEINQQVATARQYPRRSDQQITREIVTRATMTEEVASECIYSLKRGGKTLVGPSIRLAEIARGSFGNIRVASRFVCIDMDDPQRAAVIVEAAAHDMQTNNSEVIAVRRSIMTSEAGGKTAKVYSADMVNTTVLAAIAIARRNAIMAVIPRSIWGEAYHAAIRVVRGDADTFKQRLDKALAFFKSVDVEPDELCQALHVRDVGEITLDHMPALVGMWTAIKDGETVDSVLERQRGGEATPHKPVAHPMREHGEGNGKTQADAKPEVKMVRDPYTGETIPDPDSAPARVGADGLTDTQRRVADQTAQAVNDADRPRSTDDNGPRNSQAADGSPAQTKPAAANDAKPRYTDAASYITHMNNLFQYSTSETAVRNEWSATRKFRGEHCTEGQLDVLKGSYNATIERLKASQ